MLLVQWLRKRLVCGKNRLVFWKHLGERNNILSKWSGSRLYFAHADFLYRRLLCLTPVFGNGFSRQENRLIAGGRTRRRAVLDGTRKTLLLRAVCATIKSAVTAIATAVAAAPASTPASTLPILRLAAVRRLRCLCSGCLRPAFVQPVGFNRAFFGVGVHLDFVAGCLGAVGGIGYFAARGLWPHILHAAIGGNGFRQIIVVLFQFHEIGNVK